MISWARLREGGAQAGLDWALAALVSASALALVWLSPGSRSEAAPVSLALLLVATLPLGRRRQHPFAIFLLVGVAALLHVALGYNNDFAVTFAVLLALFSVAEHSSRRRAATAALLVALLLPVSFGLDWSHQHQVVLSDIPYNYGLFISAWVLGDDFRQRRIRLSELKERAARVESEQAVRLDQAAEHERRRIARELHDVIAHSVAVMVLQAGAARRIAAQQPGAAVQALGDIERIGRDAMGETRRLLGLTRSTPQDSLPAPQPRLADLEPLLELTRKAGIEVELRIQGEPRRLPEGLELSAYRIVQESLTNAIRHSDARSASVLVEYRPGELRLQVSDDGHGSPVGDGSGHGLIGIRERVALFGGTVDASPQDGHGWRVSARLPTDGDR
ncbi:MAG: sensor histidine kinase [Candidatus Dormibacteria bacterium]